MTYSNLYSRKSKLIDQPNLTHSLQGLFINSSYESNKLKCNEAYIDNFLYCEDMSMQTTLERLKDIWSCHMLPIREIEKNPLGMCNIKCENFDVKVEVENVGPYSLNITDDIFILPPLPCDIIDTEKLKIDLMTRKTYVKPILVPKQEIANLYDDVCTHNTDKECCASSLLYKAYGKDVHKELVKIFLSGYDISPVGYVVAKSSHEPPSLNAVTIKPFEKFIMTISKPRPVPYFAISNFWTED